MEQQPELPTRLVGGLGWLAVGAVVAAWDLRANESLSAAFRRYQPYSGLVLGYTAAHLMGWLPESCDLFKFVVKNPTESC